MIEEKVHEDDRMAAKTALLIFYAELNVCILQICLLQNEHQQSNNILGPVSQAITN